MKENKNCFVYGIDEFLNNNIQKLDKYKVADLNTFDFDIDFNEFDYVLLLDVIEHLSSPEEFLKKLYSKMSLNPDCKLIISTPNVANIFIRLMLLFGNFNYGSRGILDRTHTRLFTKSTFVKIMEENNFKNITFRFIPIPIPLVTHNKVIAKIGMKVQKILNIFFGKIFSFQFLIVSKPNPSLEYLISEAEKNQGKE